MTSPPRKKLIEVALPLDAINRESAREKSIRHGHPSTLHLWWARRPLAACRAVLFSSLVDDPSSDPDIGADLTGEAREGVIGERREHLHAIIRELVKWENSNNEAVINAARAEIARSVASRLLELGQIDKDLKLPGGDTVWDLIVRGKHDPSAKAIGLKRPPAPESVNAFLAEHAPPVLDPFCGGGSIPLEAQRLGLRAYASDLNPVPVLITKALIEIPPKFANMPPVHPDALAAGPESAGKGKRKGSKGQTAMGTGSWKGAQGLAADVRAYGKWMRDEAEKRIGHLYPKIRVTEAMARDRKDLRDYVGQELTVIAWLWARTVPSPNPAAAGAHVPLVRSFWLSTKKGKEAWVEPVVAPDGKYYRFEVHAGTPGNSFDPKNGTVQRSGGTCLLTGQPIPFDYIRDEGKAGRMGDRLMAIVAEGARGRVYLSPTEEHEQVARSAKPKDYPDTPLPEKALSFRVMLYGMDRHYKLFTPRQLVALTTFSDLVMEARERVLADARRAGGAGLAPGGAASRRAGTPAPPAARAGTAGVRASTVAVKGSTATDEGSLATDEGSTTTVRGSTAAVKGSTGAVQGSSAPVEASTRAVDGSTAPADGLPEPASGDPEAPDAAERYADAVATYLAFSISRMADRHSALTRWDPNPSGYAPKIASTFGRQALPMVWDFAEGNPYSDSSGNLGDAVEWVSKVIGRSVASPLGIASQRDACLPHSGKFCCCTDPPYYDNIGYADLSDYFYVWIRRPLARVYPALLRTLLTPKAEELIATPHRHNESKQRAMEFFEAGLSQAFKRMSDAEHPDYPLTVFYAFKQAESSAEESDEPDVTAFATASTGWETMLEGLISAGLAITGTWPMRTELSNRMVGTGTNALASSIVLVCHPRPDSAPMASRREFVTALKRELPDALRDLQSANIAPVDLAQAAIGPGMAVFSRYAKVIEASGERMGVRAALALINQVLDEVLAEQEGDFDADSRWALAWFEQHGFDEGEYGVAEILSKAKNTSVRGLEEAGILAAARGHVRLLKPHELRADWDPLRDKRLTTWEMVHYLVRALESDGSEQAAAALVAKLGGNAETARELCYRLYTICERKKRAQEATSYNGLVQSWPEISRMARDVERPRERQGELRDARGE